MAESAAPAKAASAAVTKPERPDEEAYKKNLAKAEAELQKAQENQKRIQAKVDNARPNNKDSPAAKRQLELRAELKTIREKQQGSKAGRGAIMDKIKRLDEKLKAQISDSKNQRSKVNFKSAEDVQQEIARLQKQVDSGSMKLVDEKKALDEISKLNKIKKGFAGFEEAQKSIDQVKAEIASLRKELDDPESKALSERYTEITTELDKIKAEQDEVFKSLNTLRDERTKAQEEQQKKYAAVKELKDAYFQQRRAAIEYEKEARRIRIEKKKAEDDAYHRGRRQEAAKAKLEDASAPAYQDEIRTTQSLLAYFDPSSVSKQQVTGPGKFAATDFRKVDGSGIKGTALKKKGEDEENYFIGGGGKKKGRKGPRSTAAEGTTSPPAETSGKFNLDLGTIDSLARIGVDPPMSQADVPAVVEKLKEKLAFWKGDQERKTKENIANAQKEIDRLEAEATEANNAPRTTENGTKSAHAKQQVNGSANAGAEQEEEKDAVTEATDDLQKASIDDKAATEATA